MEENETGKRIVETSMINEDVDIEFTLRPKTLDEYVGQKNLKEKMKIFIEAAVKRGEPLDHVLLYGPPGLGKTTMAGIIANELKSNIKITSGPAIERPGDLAAILTNLSEGDVLFIDEVHRLNKSVEEVLYPAMEDFALDIIIGKGPGARSVRIDLPKFTIIGATTRAGMVSSPLRDRFGIVSKLEFYSIEELINIASRSAFLLKVDLTKEGAAEIGSRARGTPRLANRLLKRVRDYAEVKANGIIDEKTANEALDLLEVDKHGLDNIDRNMLFTIINKFGGGPVGLETLAASIGEDSGTIEDVCEPYLLQMGFINRTPKGRVATKRGYEALGIEFQE